VLFLSIIIYFGATVKNEAQKVTQLIDLLIFICAFPDTIKPPKLLMNLKVSAYPNPFASSISLEVVCEQNEQVIFRLYNPDKKIIKMSYWKLVHGMNKIILDNLERLTAGAYLIELNDQDEKKLYSAELVKE
jgi:hypothetical protein